MINENTCPSPEYLEFSYQGLTLWLHSGDLTVNKAAAQSEIYGRNTPITTDTSNKAETFSFTGILSGQDVLLQENALRLAASMPMPHLIVHPSFGLISANIHSVKFSTDYKGSLGITTVTIDGSDWGNDISCGFDLLNIALDGLIAAIAVSFFQRYVFDGVPAWRKTQLQQFSNNIESVVNSGVSDYQGYYVKDGNWSYIAQSTFDNTIKVIQELPVDEGRVNGLKSIISKLQVPIYESPLVNLQDAIVQCTRLTAIIKLISIVKDKKYLTANHAFQDKTFILDALRAEIRAGSNSGSQELIKAAYELEKAYIADYNTKNRNLAPIITRNFPEINNSISIAHQLYGNGARFKEIEELNPHLTPLFMQGVIYAAAR
jgi:prophage DNA circulation protein